MEYFHSSSSSQALALPEMLQAYPFPAFVLTHLSSTTSLLPDAVTTPLPSPPSTPYSRGFPKVLYANERWHAAARGRPLHDCLSPDDQTRLLCWLQHCVARASANIGQGQGPGVASELHDDPHCDDDDDDDDKPPALAFFDFAAMQSQAYSEREKREQEQANACAAAAAAAASAASSPVAVAALPSSPAGGHLREGVRPNDAMAPVPVYVGTLEDKGTLECGGHVPSECTKYKPGDYIFWQPDGSIKTAGREMHLGQLPSVHTLMETMDWSKTPLGPMSQWSERFRAMVDQLFHNPLAGILYWGKGKNTTVIYNAAMAQGMSDHPARFGAFGEDVMQEVETSLGPLADLLETGSTVVRDDEPCYRADFQGVMREAYRRCWWGYFPGSDGEYGGILHMSRDSTSLVLSERRSAMLCQLGDRNSTARTLRDFESGLLETLHPHPKDIPFAFLYQVELPGNALRKPSEARLRYAGGVGVPDQHDNLPESLRVSLAKDAEKTPPATAGYDEDSDYMASPANSYASTLDSITYSDPRWAFAEVLNTSQSVVVDCEHLTAGFPIRVWDRLPNQALVIPLSINSDHGVPGAILVIGISPKLRFEDTYKTFTDVLRIQAASGLAAVRSYTAHERRLVDLRALDRAKSAMFSSVSHELLGPLNLISGPIDDVVADLAEKDAKRDLLNMAQRNTRRLGRLVSMLMDISALDAGRLQNTFERVNIGILTRDVAALFRKTATKAKLHYTVICDEKPRSVYVNREGWEKIICCLIENALKFTVEGFVRVCLEYTRHAALLSVTCSATNIPGTHIEEFAQGLFPSERAASSDREGDGNDSAISLMLAQKLVNVHHGDLEMERRMLHETQDGSAGTMFRVRLPLGASHLSAEEMAVSVNGDSVTEEAANGRSGCSFTNDLATWYPDVLSDDTDTTSSLQSTSSGETKRSRGSDPSGLNFIKEDRVLVVEDLPDAQQYMRSIFETYCKVQVARSGKEAMRICDIQRPDLIIAEVEGVGMSGIELLDALRAGPRDQRTIPVILLTSIDDVRNAGVLRADDYLAKPFNARDLLTRANMQLQLGKKWRTMEMLFEERTQELRLLSDNSPAGIFRCDEYGRAVYNNPAWLEMCGMDEMCNDWGSFAHDDTRDIGNKKWMDFLANPDAQVMRLESRWKNGRWVWTTLTKLAAGGIIGSGIDITDRKQHDQLQALRIEEAEKRRAEAEEARKQQELLIDITSHEIRNPISSLMQCSSMVLNNILMVYNKYKVAVETNTPFLPTEQLLVNMEDDIEALESIYQCGLAQERISNDVLSLGKMQLNALYMYDVETDLRRVGQKVLSIFQSEARMNRVTMDLSLSKAFEDHSHDTVMTDPVRLTQIITNLVSNAIRFTANSKERKVQLAIDIGYDPPVEGSCIKPAPTGRPVSPGDTIYAFFSVRDTGPGLTPAELETLFQRYTQASPMTHTVFGGSGLGLFVCRKLAERMGGRIDVLSTYGEGSDFRFFIRTEPVKPGVVPRTLDGPRSLASGLRSDSPQTLDGLARRVLVVEDNVINRKVLLRQLKHVGIDVEAAPDGFVALNQIQKAMAVPQDLSPGEVEPYDCVLMDLEMPVMDGYTATRKVRELEAAGAIRRTLIIALTGNARQVQVKEGMADFDAAVVKPYRLDDMLRQMERLIQLREEPRGAGGGDKGEA